MNSENKNRFMFSDLTQFLLTDVGAHIEMLRHSTQKKKTLIFQIRIPFPVNFTGTNVSLIFYQVQMFKKHLSGQGKYFQLQKGGKGKLEDLPSWQRSPKYPASQIPLWHNPVST